MAKETENVEANALEELEKSIGELEQLAGVSSSDPDDDEEEDETASPELVKSKKKKSKADADDDDDDDDGDKVVDRDTESDDDDDDDDDEDMAKSVTEDWEEDDNLVKAVEISPFLNSLVERSRESFADLQGELQESRRHNRQLMKSFASAWKSMSTAIIDLTKKVDTIIATPAPAAKPKGVVSVLERSFQGNNPEKKVEAAPLSKSQVSEVLSQLVIDKKASEIDLIRWESSNQMSPSVAKLVQNQLAGKAA